MSDQLTDEELLQLQESAGAGSEMRKAKHFWPSAKRLLGLLWEHPVSLAVGVVLNAVSIIFAVWGPVVMGQAIDSIVEGDGRLTKLCMQIVVIYVIAAVLDMVSSLVLNKLIMTTMYRLRSRIESTLNRLPMNYFDSRQRGDLLSRTTNDIDNLQNATQQTLSSLVNASISLAFIIVMMFLISPLLATATLVVFSLAGVITAVVGGYSQKQFVAQWRATGQLNGHVEESFSGHDVALIFGRTEALAEGFEERNAELYGSSRRAQFSGGTIFPSMMFLGHLAYVVIAVLGALRVSAGALSLGQAVAFIQYARMINQPLGEVGGMIQMVQSGVASAERIFEFLDAPAEEDAATGSGGEIGEGLVEFTDVAFSYHPESPLITGLNLRAEPGQTVAIVGHTGAGKTTLVNLLMRFYDIDSGTITIDGVDTRTIPRQELRSHIGMVLQDAVLFKGTIMDNIRYGRLDATDDEVIEAAKAAYVDRFVHALPDGYDTIVDQDSGAISVGERQLITIARAFISEPTILVLDEATSSVDTRTEVLVQRAMKRLRSSRTSFVIAHRLSTIRDAHTILVMRDGSIVEQGTHDELIARGGEYARLHASQFNE